MNNPLVLINQDQQGITVLTLNRAEKRNALNIELMEEFCNAFEMVLLDPSQRAIVIQGKGSVFCAGLDLNEAADPGKILALAEMVSRLLKSLYTSPLVTIALVHGVAAGGGAGLMSACDFVVATKDARMGYPETRRGLIAAQVMTILLRQLRERDARELLLMGELINAEKALSIGLINKIVASQADLLSEAYEIFEKIAKGAPEATKETKQLLHDLYPSNFDDDIKKAFAIYMKVRQSSEAEEGLQAFLDNRPPSWE